MSVKPKQTIKHNSCNGCGAFDVIFPYNHSPGNSEVTHGNNICSGEVKFYFYSLVGEAFSDSEYDYWLDIEDSELPFDDHRRFA